jgi:hypothetical protein
MARIFISYRRDDSSNQARLLRRDLSLRFGANAVFRDTSNIRLGDNFVDAINAEIATAAVGLILIGPHWLARDSEGRRRIDNPGDFVRVEVAALLNGDVVVIPVLVENATMPSEEALPPELRALAFNNGISISEEDDDAWEFDVNRLSKRIAEVLGVPTQLPPPSNPRPTPPPITSPRVDEGGTGTGTGMAPGLSAFNSLVGVGILAAFVILIFVVRAIVLADAPATLTPPAATAVPTTAPTAVPTTAPTAVSTRIRPVAVSKPSSGPFIIVFSSDKQSKGSEDEIRNAPPALARDGRVYKVYYVNVGNDDFWYAATLGPYVKPEDAANDRATLAVGKGPEAVTIEDFSTWCREMVPAAASQVGYDTCPVP